MSAKVAIVHYWFLGIGGGERVVEALAEMYPQADLFCLVADPMTMTPALRAHRLTTSFLQKIPGSRRWYKQLLPLQPLALEHLDLFDYDLIISSESGPAKGVITRADACHVCYCHSPMRYIWDLYRDYRAALGPISRTVFSLTAHYVRMWDLASAQRVDYFVANSQNVANRIEKHYRRNCEVIYPPVDTTAGYIAQDIDNYYLVVGRLVDYKRIDLAIEACNRLRRPLHIIGNGPEYSKLRKVAGPTVRFLGRVPDEVVRSSYARCRALLFPGEEDFGLVPVEVQSFGRPVVAYARGGVLETVIGIASDASQDPKIATGVFFDQQTRESLEEAILRYESLEERFAPGFIRNHAGNFDKLRFKQEIGEFIGSRLTRLYVRDSGTQVVGAGVR
jgi:glycosyltransferase involved in cell wall biosynthesis